MAVPIRTMVAPSAMAESKSSVIPIESVSRFKPWAFSESWALRTAANVARCAAVSKVGAGMAINPRRLMFGNASTA